jgi:hypothetical protein
MPLREKLSFGYIDFRLDHVLHAEGKIGHVDLFLHPVVHTVDALVVVAGEMQHCFPHRLAGDRTCVHGGAPYHFALLYQGGALARFRRLDGGPLSRGSGADGDEVVRLHVSPDS